MTNRQKHKASNRTKSTADEIGFKETFGEAIETARNIWQNTNEKLHKRYYAYAIYCEMAKVTAQRVAPVPVQPETRL